MLDGMSAAELNLFLGALLGALGGLIHLLFIDQWLDRLQKNPQDLEKKEVQVKFFKETLLGAIVAGILASQNFFGQPDFTWSTTLTLGVAYITIGMTATAWLPKVYGYAKGLPLLKAIFEWIASKRAEEEEEELKPKKNSKKSE